MIIYTTGDLLNSKAEVLVNTVNCEGYMGKGIAYQFKLKFPLNNDDYVKACKSGDLTIGKLHYFKEGNKLIVNFPTKNKWRAKSKMEYVESGLEELVKLIIDKEIKSIALPPLGSGNGGLNWNDVKRTIEDKLQYVSEDVSIYIYEPSRNYVSKASKEPELGLSALILMKMKLKLIKFDKIRLQKTSYFFNIFSGVDYFKFIKHMYGPYDNSISIISKKIKAYQDYHSLNETSEAIDMLYKKIISDKIETKLIEYSLPLEKAVQYVNTIETNHELECLSTIAFIVNKNRGLDLDSIVKNFNMWSTDKSNRFSDDEIINGVYKLCEDFIIENTFTGYQIYNYTTNT